MVGPVPANSTLPVFKSAAAVHDDPFQISVSALDGPASCPPAVIALVEVPPDPAA